MPDHQYSRTSTKTYAFLELTGWKPETERAINSSFSVVFPSVEYTQPLVLNTTTSSVMQRRDSPFYVKKILVNDIAPQERPIARARNQKDKLESKSRGKTKLKSERRESKKGYSSPPQLQKSIQWLWRLEQEASER